MISKSALGHIPQSEAIAVTWRFIARNIKLIQATGMDPTHEVSESDPGQKINIVATTYRTSVEDKKSQIKGKILCQLSPNSESYSINVQGRKEI